jgi:serine protease Do
MNRQKVTSVQEFREAVQSLPEGKAVSVRVVRQGRALYLVMKP